MRVLVLLNSSAGILASSRNGDELQRIQDQFSAANVSAEIRILDAEQLTVTLQTIADEKVDAVIGGGGDGTLNSIANALSGTGIAFGVLPLGTHNHFAKDMQIPLDLDQAAAALSTGVARDIDVGEVNGRIFLNFSAIGLHPSVIKHRDAQRHALGRPKFFAMFLALGRMVLRLRPMRVRFSFGDVTLQRVTPSVVICNNAHQVEVLGLQNVSHTDRRMLNVYTARSAGRLGLLWLIVRGLFRQLQTARAFEVLKVAEIRIDTNKRHARVSIDGEVTDLRTPLHYRIRRGGLRVIVPADRPLS